jgi:hypothetical protein
MPQTINDQSVYISTGNPETFFNQTALYKPGELGKKFTAATGNRYQIVQCDSAATTSLSTVANGLVYWSNRAQFKVVPQATDPLNLAKLNGVAGRCPGITAVGNYFAMQIAGPAVLVYAGTTTAGAVGGAIIANSSTLSDSNAVTYGTAPSQKVVGWITVAATATQVTGYLCLDDAEVG